MAETLGSGAHRGCPGGRPRRPYGCGMPKLPRRHLVRLFLVAAAVLVPWSALLATTLPMTVPVRRWAVGWVGLDLLQAVALAATGWLLHRRHPAASLTAGVAAGLLLVDGWFDMTTSAIGWDYLMALALAVLVEFPLAVLCLLVGYRTAVAVRPAGPG